MRNKLPFILLALTAVSIALITVFEHQYGAKAAYEVGYGSWWFKALWGVVTSAALFLMCKKRLWSNRPVFLLHISFLIILLGALTTSLTSHRGIVSLREGETSMHYMEPEGDGYVMHLKSMPFYLTLDSFRVEYDADGVTPSDYVSYVQLSDKKDWEKMRISMNNIGRAHGYRIFQTSYDEDLHGSVLTVSYDPWGTAMTYFGYLLLAISMCLTASRHGKKRGVVQTNVEKTSEVIEENRTTWRSILLWLLGILLASYMVIAIAFRPLMPILRSPMLVVHVGTIMISYVLLIVSMLNRNLLRVAVFFLAAGIFLGAMWANISWGTYWSWDPKESWALITLIVYSIPLHHKSLPWFQSERHYRLYCVLCILCLLMTYFGVNFLLGGMHSYVG